MSKASQADEIRALVTSNPGAAEQALLVLYARQTADEQADHETRHENGMGFTGADAQLLSSFAEQVSKGRRLSPKQLVYAHKKLAKYGGQLEGCGFEYSPAAVPAPAPAPAPVARAKLTPAQLSSLYPLTARFPGRCRICGKSLDVGDSILWSKELGGYHPACAGDEALVSRPVAPVVSVPVAPAPVASIGATTVYECRAPKCGGQFTGASSIVARQQTGKPVACPKCGDTAWYLRPAAMAPRFAAYA